ncbi:MAG: ABC transporter permease [Clostridia bacterium]|jgi:putative ABC transport system permease protein|nr:ABC transporter permease [Clostridia bacterium]
MSLVAATGALELGFAYALLAFGIYISFRILNIPDLTVDGSFVLGAAVSAVLTGSGHPVPGIAVAALAGCAAGCVTAIQQTKFGIPPILAGILTMTGLYSINLLVMSGKANVPMLGKTNVFSLLEKAADIRYSKLVILFFVVLLVFLFYNYFFKTQLGLSIRATGDNEAMVRASSIDTDMAKIIGFGLSNATVAVSGALVAQMQQSADINMGAGMIVIGLASLIIGDAILKNKTVFRGLLSVIIGSVVYRFLIALILTTSLPPSFLKLISALVVAVAISLPNLRVKTGFSRLRIREGE